MVDAYERYKEGRSLLNKNIFRAVLFCMCVGAAIGPLADFMDRRDLRNGKPATVVVASRHIKAPERCFASGDCQLSVKVTPDAGAPFHHLMVFNRSRIDRLLQGDTMRVRYVADRPARHLVEGDPLPPIGWGMALLSLALLGTFGVSLRLK